LKQIKRQKTTKKDSPCEISSVPAKYWIHTHTPAITDKAIKKPPDNAEGFVSWSFSLVSS